MYLIVDHGHVKIAKLLQSIGQVGMSFCHVWVQHDAAVVESNALLVVAKLVIDGSNEQKDVRAIYILADIGLHVTAIRCWAQSHCRRRGTAYGTAYAAQGRFELAKAYAEYGWHSLACLSTAELLNHPVSVTWWPQRTQHQEYCHTELTDWQSCRALLKSPVRYAL